MLGLITMAVGKLFGAGETWVAAKTKQETLKVENKVALDQAKTNASITKQQKDADACNDIDLITVKNQRYTWSDELFKIVMLTPFILMFHPDLQQTVADGFKFFEAHAPDFYKYILYGIAISELGLRRIFMKLFDTMSTIRTGKK